MNLDHGERYNMKIVDCSVCLIDVMGNDLSVVNSARVSFNKESEPYYWVDSKESEVEYKIPMIKAEDGKLIKYLADHNHWTPFAHNAISLRMKAPIFIARQLDKTRIGLVWNEVSRRYVDYEPEFYLPEKWRKRSENKKQGSSSESFSNDDIDNYICDIEDGKNGCVFTPKESIENALETYEILLKQGVCPEQARIVLPQNMMTEWIWTGSMLAFSRLCMLRCAPDTQEDTQNVANKIFPICDKLFPVSWYHLMYNKFPDRNYECNRMDF